MDHEATPGRRGHTQARPRAWIVRIACVLAICAAGFGCDEKKPSAPNDPPGSLPDTTGSGALAEDFHLLDVNPNSASTGDSISPRDELGSISAWYFGHAT